MADIAAAFHWSIDDMSALPLDELIAWQERAIDRLKAIHGGGE